MASGKSIELAQFTQEKNLRKTKREMTKFRRRTLNGKARVRERKQARQQMKEQDTDSE